MARAELRWPPYPYRAGFCITDDTDTATLASVRAVYDVLAAHGVLATKTVWAAPPEEPCGIPPLPDKIQRGSTLAEPEYLSYCAELGQRGFEITLHGATAGNNRRALIERAYALMDRHFPRSPTHICHARNADNPYWQDKLVGRGPLRMLMAWAARGHRCSGEVPGSPYFWGDLCLERVRYIRLMRTRRLNTLAANPSMPYFEREKPFVNGWFSASKRSFRDATSAAALEALEAEWGLTVLYQYLCRYADPTTGGVLPAFLEGVVRLAARPRTWRATTGAIMDRLRLMQGVFLCSRGDALWLVNTTDEDATGVQISTDARLQGGAVPGITAEPGLVHVARVAAGAMLRIGFDRSVEARGRRAVQLSAAGTGRADFGHGELRVNVGTAPWATGEGEPLMPSAHMVRFAPGLEETRPRSRASDFELTRLFLEQALIFAREVLFRGRATDINRFLGAREIQLEDHDRW